MPRLPVGLSRPAPGRKKQVLSPGGGQGGAVRLLCHPGRNRADALAAEPAEISVSCWLNARSGQSDCPLFPFWDQERSLGSKMPFQRGRNAIYFQ